MSAMNGKKKLYAEESRSTAMSKYSLHIIFDPPT